MKRSVWKLPYIQNTFFKKRTMLKHKLLFRLRNSSIPATLLDKRVLIYNGVWYLSINVVKNMIGLKLGEFAFTKRSDTQVHLKRKSKKKSKKN